jgi:hypothetical protein
MFSSTLYVVAIMIAAISIQAAPIVLFANDTSIAPYVNNTNSTNGHHYTHSGPGVSLADLEQGHTNSSSVDDSVTDKKDDGFSTGVIVILAVGSIAICGGLAWFLYHLYNEFA